MSLDIFMWLNERVVTSPELLEKLIKNLWGNTVQLHIEAKQGLIMCNDLYQDMGFTISLRESIPPYNIYDSNLLNTEFFHKQVICFGVNKEGDTTNIYNAILKFIVFLGKTFTSDLLVTSTFCDEICYRISKGNIIFNKKVSFISNEIISSANEYSPIGLSDL